MEPIGPELVRIFRSRHGGATAAEQWARCLHGSFYGTKLTRGSNKFLALESTLTEVFSCLCSDESACSFWQFTVRVLLVLAQEPIALPRTRSPQDDGRASNTPAAKKTPTKCQPNAPLAFLVVNALKKLIKGDRSNEQAEQCRAQGQHNEELRAFCTNGLGRNSDIDQKLLVELLELFQMTDIDPELVRGSLERHLDSKSHSALIKLCGTFSNVDWPFEAIVARMVRSKDWTSAELLVRTYEADGDTALAKILIDEVIELHDFKRAHRLVTNFELQKEYPNIDVLYSRDGLLRLIDSQRWQLAITFVGHDPTLQKVLLEHMVAAGELAQATQLVTKLETAGFGSDISKIIKNHTSTEASQSEFQVAEGKEYLTSSLEDKDIVFCDAEETVRLAMHHFFGSNDKANQSLNVKGIPEVVGLDVEWKPVTSRFKSRTAVASILQIASPTRVFIIDLLKLHDNDYLFEGFLLTLFTSPQLLKLGFSFDSDLKVLHQTFPERQAFATVTPFLDLNVLPLKPSESIGTSLSQVSRHILGKPLDKRMQLSDWEQRPLSPAQLTYAALDALCLIQIVEKAYAHPGYQDSWDDAREHITSLANRTMFTKAKILEATSVRVDYHRKWSLQHGGEKHVETASVLVKPQDIARIWEERSTTQSINSTLKFLPMGQIKRLLEETKSSQRNFVAVNSICIFADEMPCVVCVDASCKLDMASFARFRGVGRRKVRLATEVECREVFGFAPGTVAPFGHRPAAGNGDKAPEIEVYADSSLKDAQYVAAGCGSHDEVLWVESQALFSLANLTMVSEISTPRDPSISTSPRSPGAESDDDRIDATTAESPKVLEYKFLADSMVTQVGRWLRAIGIDVVNWDPDSIEVTRSHDPKSIMLARATKEDRIVLTRDTSLPSRRDAGACFVLSDPECYKQYREVKLQFGLQERMKTQSSRCARCNSAKFSSIDAVTARQKLSERLRKRVPASVTKFWICNKCSKVYWSGPKYQHPSEPSADGSVMYRPVPRKRITADKHDTRHLP